MTDIVEEKLDALWKNIISFPFAEICKHSVAGKILSLMEELGYDVPKELARAVVFADDETALNFDRKNHISS